MSELYYGDDILSDDAVRHGFFGRGGGVSRGIYSSLNCGIGSGDDPAAVRENRRRVAAAMGAAPENFVTLHQVHSALCVTVTKPWGMEQRPQADALVTDVPGLAIGVLTADCAPVLFRGRAADGRTVIGAAHAGWGGAVKGVLEATVAAMGAQGVAPGDLRAAIGPCIGPDSYEVGEAFRAPFIAQDAANAEFFSPATRPGHEMFDLPAYAARRLRAAGVTHVACRGIDTFFNEEDYFSYRRSTHRTEPDYGRQVAVIAIKA
jgi:YfiH family protein